MIAIIAGDFLEAKRYARAQDWSDDEWFFPIDERDLNSRCDFHVIVIGTAGQNTPPSYFNRILELAKQRGRINNK